MENPEPNKAEQDAAKLISDEQAKISEDKEFTNSVKQDMQSAWPRSESPGGGLVAFNWLWSYLFRGLAGKSGLGKVIYFVVWLGILFLVFLSLSKLLA